MLDDILKKGRAVRTRLYGENYIKITEVDLIYNKLKYRLRKLDCLEDEVFGAIQVLVWLFKVIPHWYEIKLTPEEQKQVITFVDTHIAELRSIDKRKQDKIDDYLRERFL